MGSLTVYVNLRLPTYKNKVDGVNTVSSFTVCSMLVNV